MGNPAIYVINRNGTVRHVIAVHTWSNVLSLNHTPRRDGKVVVHAEPYEYEHHEPESFLVDPVKGTVEREKMGIRPNK
jgi:hypothetical protein